MELSVIVPTFNEAGNVAELVRRARTALVGLDVEIIFVDDSTDDTPQVVTSVAATAPLPVRLIHREAPTGGLGGAVVEGIMAAASDVCVVMDGDLQHPPEQIRALLAKHHESDVDVVVASRYLDGGSSGGLADRARVLVSRASTALTKAMFPRRLSQVTDPMTGFFLIDRRSVEWASLHPRGFKILLEILARRTLRVAEVPFVFEERFAGESKASLRQGVHFLTQLAALRFGKMSGFALIGAGGAVANLAIMAALIQMGAPYLVAAIIAAEVTIVTNFLLQDRFVFRDMRDHAAPWWARFATSFTFNNAEAVIRIPVLAWMVEALHIQSIAAAAITLAVAFVVRFVFHSLVVYAPRRPSKDGSTDQHRLDVETDHVRKEP
ncbi:glycosyltransferase [Demequina muriae]|uniref:Glycosyltransferase family 2 protein n=1 Tax=Demequina muriae TaxID=3051664 RepID=A0ABT8GK20_9MICO|nr:glycosyltransferase family 2 protein [Demequina sp. EGI L300058]MDN4481772.1 glycosyltransferase family 2 protein [Demequina sp. EGI L300058]